MKPLRVTCVKDCGLGRRYLSLILVISSLITNYCFSAIYCICLSSKTVLADPLLISEDFIDLEHAAETEPKIKGSKFARRGQALEWEKFLESPIVTPSPNYLSRKGELLHRLWLDDSGINRNFEEYLDFLRDLQEDGLVPNDYGLDILKGYVELGDDEERVAKNGRWELSQLCNRSLIKLLSDLHWGRRQYRLRDLTQTNRVDGVPLISDDNRNILEYHLDQALDAPDLIQYLREQLPNHPQYLQLKNQLAIFRELASSDDIKEVEAKLQIQVGISSKARLAAGQPFVYLKALKQHGDLSTSNYRGVERDVKGVSELITTHPLFIKAVKRFQFRMGLTADGVMGSNTLKELATPAAERAQTIAMNLERWRWLPHATEDSFWNTFLMVNTAGFELVFVRDRKLVDRMPVIVGTRYNRTPTFSAIVEAIELNPFWNVPASIANNELWPKERRSPGSLNRQNIKILSGGRLRQDPGPGNALGRIKFVLPNPFSVYLHDTPTKQLFNHDVRAFSHGCIRVSRPVDLALEILNSESPQWTAEEITNLINKGSNRRLNLENHIPIHIIYRTAWVEADGAVHFRQDIYGKDPR